MQLVFALLLIVPFQATLAGGDHGHGHAHDHPAHAATQAGRPGDPRAVSRTIEITMHDNMRFVPDHVRVGAGETVRFRIRNQGRLRHEFVLGTEAELQAHARQMRARPAMRHDDPGSVSLAPGRAGEIVWRFDQPGAARYACLIPGHAEAGMVGTVEVVSTEGT